jgi:hypothetical protein
MNTIVVAVHGQVSSDLGGEVVILSLEDGIYYGLDEVGARVWSLIQTPTAVSSIRDVILEEYDVDAPQCERDLLALLDGLAAHGLVEVRDGKAS